jgi:ubiquinone/menaquinone biosynthesis C-methylase UbiE
MPQLRERIPEPELMDEWEQAEAYARADFSAPHEMFVDLFVERFGDRQEGLFIDLGCGSADITIRMARRCPRMKFHGVDGSKAMLHFAQRAISTEGLDDRIRLFLGRIPEFTCPLHPYDGAVINSLLHHLPDPAVLWDYLKRYVKKGGIIFVMDLMRPASTEQASDMVERYSGSEPEVLKRDFYNSLLAAFRPDEVRRQLEQAGLFLDVEEVSDRHLLLSGHL